MKYCFVIFLGLICLFGSVAVNEARCETYAGSLSSADGGLEGVGGWVDPGDATISWEITDMGSYYHYEYTLSVSENAKEISHFITEVSGTFAESNFWNGTGAFGCTEIDDFDTSNGNPDIPGTVHGLKFDETSGTTLTIAFDSNRLPVWGDFYAKGGVDTVQGGPNVTNQVWNAGLSVADPTAAPANGSLNNHLLVPDTMTVVVPEPTTLSLLLAGLLGVAFVVRRRS
ncbi:MAG: PEP-CTERM sorting domain-containing protein [Planctomycetia bacterium]|jgi:hypothetical protein